MYELEHVTKTYRQGRREVRALDDVDLEIADGDYVAIQGQTGGGKSTLLQLLGALDKPTKGTSGSAARTSAGSAAPRSPGSARSRSASCSRAST